MKDLKNLTWGDLLERLFDALQSGAADSMDLGCVRDWPDSDSADTPLDYFGEEPEFWPHWATH